MPLSKIAVRLLPVLLVMLEASQGLLARPESKRASAGDPGGAAATDSLARRTDADSSRLLQGVMSAADYLENRERFFYPHTRREDPFSFPFSKAQPGKKGEGLSLGELELTGVLFSPDGRSVAILGTASDKQSGGKEESKGGMSILVRTGDMISGAEVVMIEAKRIHFLVREYGIERRITIELKPLMEEKANEPSRPAGGSGGQAGEGQSGYEEYGSQPPQRR
ncbi:MAG: hypothetical protein JXQ83_01585 [Candidatus Glassbacteria bacterium]|nr:hypothetical protein [Candidatus Glassbacteria bacterium]